MTVSRAKARRRAAAGFGLAAMVCAATPMGGQVWAQSAEPSPVPLIPQNILRVLPPSGALSAAPSNDQVRPSGLTATQPRQPTLGIEANPLAAVAPDLSDRFRTIDGAAQHNQRVADEERTVALRTYDPETRPVNTTAVEDGHYVVRSTIPAREDVLRFLTQALAGEIPTIGAPE